MFPFGMECRNSRRVAGASICRRILMMTVVMCMITIGETDVFALMDSIIAPCTSGSYITIDSFRAYCGIPGECGKKLTCEDQIAMIEGYIDYNNVFQRSAYPMLPYQKFLMTNQNRTQTMEVWVNPEGSEAVFKVIAEKKTVNFDGPVFVKGSLSGFDMPVMGKCLRDMKLILSGEKSIKYQRDEIFQRHN